MGQTALLMAVTKGDEMICKQLCLKFKASIDYKSESGQNLLHLAVLYSNATICEYLIKRFVDTKKSINQVDNSGETPLDYAVTEGNRKAGELMKLLGAECKQKVYPKEWL